LTTNRVRGLSVALITIFCISSVCGAVSWFATVDGWKIHRESDTLAFDMESRVIGEISSIEVTPGGQQMGGYHSRYADAELNDVRLRDRTGAYEGEIESHDLLYLRSSAKEEIKREVSKPFGVERYVFNYYEVWPVIIGAHREVRYAGRGINDREFSGNNLDYVGSGFLYNTELSKINIRNLNLYRMNVTVVAGDDGVELVSFLPTKNTTVWISAEATGISSLRYRQIAGDQKTVLSEGEDRIVGTTRQRTVIEMSSLHKRDGRGG